MQALGHLIGSPYKTMSMDYQNLQDYVEEQHEARQGGGALAGFLIGAGVGILAGLLLAPRAGKETIKQVTDRTGNWKNQLNDLIDRAGSMASTYADKGRQMAGDAKNRAQHMAGQA